MSGKAWLVPRGWGCPDSPWEGPLLFSSVPALGTERAPDLFCWGVSGVPVDLVQHLPVGFKK